MKKSRFTNVLMISSLAGLIAFLAWWNVKNYHQQKEQLISDLTTQFELARGRYNDSLIIQIFEVVDFRFPDTLSLNEPKNQKSVTSAFTRVSFSAETNEMDSLITSQGKDGLISLSLSTQGELNRDTSFSFLDSRKGKFPEMLSFDDLTVNDSGVYDVPDINRVDLYHLHLRTNHKLSLLLNMLLHF